MTTLSTPSNLHTPALDPGVDACACPECGMPMSIRLWLRSADCLRCGTSIALEYLPVAEAAPARGRAKPQATEAPNFGPAIDVDAPPRIRHSKVKRILRSLHQLLACLLSIIAHLLLLILLALWGWGESLTHDEAIDLSVVFDTDEWEGDQPNNSIETVGFEVPIESPDDNRELDAARWAAELAIEDPADAPNLPSLDRVADDLSSDDPYRRMLAARDPRIRKQILETEGGTNLTEAAVARALRWMSLHQGRDGSWSLDHFDRDGDCRGRCGNTGRLRSDEGATALVLQAMLGAGQTHRTGIYRDQVSHALQYLLDAQRPGGSLAADSSQNAGMYAHALATIAIADAYTLTGDELLRDPAQRAVNYLATAQHRAGGWRYSSGQAGDLSVTGWELMALHSARAAGLRVEPYVLDRASKFLDSVATDRQESTYGYLPGHRASAAMTAEGLLSRVYLGWRRDEPGLRRGVRELARRYPVDIRDRDTYYWYYATQLLHHWGGREWHDWNEAMSDALVTTQVLTGHEAGSWDPARGDQFDRQGGRLYATVLATCMLEVYYRHAPLFRKIELTSQQVSGQDGRRR